MISYMIYSLYVLCVHLHEFVCSVCVGASGSQKRTSDTWDWSCEPLDAFEVRTVSCSDNSKCVTRLESHKSVHTNLLDTSALPLGDSFLGSGMTVALCILSGAILYKEGVHMDDMESPAVVLQMVEITKPFCLVICQAF